MNKLTKNKLTKNKLLKAEGPGLSAASHPEWLPFFTLLFEMQDALDARREEERFNALFELGMVHYEHLLPTLRASRAKHSGQVWMFPREFQSDYQTRHECRPAFQPNVAFQSDVVFRSDINTPAGSDKPLRQ